MSLKGFNDAKGKKGANNITSGSGGGSLLNVGMYS